MRVSNRVIPPSVSYTTSSYKLSTALMVGALSEESQQKQPVTFRIPHVSFPRFCPRRFQPHRSPDLIWTDLSQNHQSVYPRSETHWTFFIHKSISKHIGHLLRHQSNGWKIKYPEIGYPEFCQLIEQENRDPNKALGQSIKITVALQFAFCVAWVPLNYS